MSLFLRDSPGEIADIATKVADIFCPQNRDLDLGYEDFLHEITIQLSKRSRLTTSGQLWPLAIDVAIDLLGGQSASRLLLGLESSMSQFAKAGGE